MNLSLVSSIRTTCLPPPLQQQPCGHWESICGWIQSGSLSGCLTGNPFEAGFLVIVKVWCLWLDWESICGWIPCCNLSGCLTKNPFVAGFVVVVEVRCLTVTGNPFAAGFLVVVAVWDLWRDRQSIYGRIPKSKWPPD